MKIKVFFAAFAIAFTTQTFANPSISLLDAIEQQDEQLVGSLLRTGVNPNDNSLIYNTTPLIYAVELRAANIVESLLEHGTNVDVSDNFGNTPIINAINTNKDDIAHILIKKSRNINSKDHKGISALQYAANQGNEPLFRKILEKGGDLKAVDQSGNNALFYALAGRNKEIIGRLLNMKYFDLSYTNKSGESALKIAQHYGLHDVASYLSRGRNN